MASGGVPRHTHAFTDIIGGKGAGGGAGDVDTERAQRIAADAALEAAKVNRVGDDRVTGQLRVGQSKVDDQAGTGERMVLAQETGQQRAEAKVVWTPGTGLVLEGLIKVKATAGSGGWSFADRASTPGYQGAFFCSYDPTALGPNGPVLNIYNEMSTDALPNAPQFSLWPGELNHTQAAYRAVVVGGVIWQRNMLYQHAGSIGRGGWSWEAQGAEVASITAAGVVKFDAHAGTGQRMQTAMTDGTLTPTSKVTVDATTLDIDLIARANSVRADDQAGSGDRLVLAGADGAQSAPANVGTAGSVGAADSTLSITTDAQGRVTARSAQAIAITPAQAGADPAGTAAAAIVTHVAVSDPHTQYRLESVAVPWGDLSGVPSTFAPSAHASSHASGGGDPVTLAQSQVTNLTTDLAAKAPLASPALTGNPTAPTPAAGDNDTSIATTAFVNAEIAADAAPLSHVGAGGAAHAAATTSVAGFMSAADKTKLDGVAAGAEVNVNADWNAVSGDAQILNKPASFTPSAHASTHAPAGSDALPWTTAHGRGLASARPAAASTNAGYIYYSTDTQTLERSSGSAWETIGSAASITLAADREVNAAEPPASSDSRLRGPWTINYCTNPDAELNNTTGWATYVDAAGTLPVDGTGGTPPADFLIDVGDAYPMRGAYYFGLVNGSTSNRQGHGASYDFTIDTTDTNRQLTVAFDVQIIPGSTWTAGTVTVHVYDVTNGKLVPITANSIDASGRFVAHFTTNSSTSYRLILHVASTAAAAWTMAFDSVYIGPAWVPGAPAMSDYQSYTPTFQGFGTVSAYDVRYARRGAMCIITGRFTPGTPTAVEARIGLPPGLTIDATHIPSVRPVGIGARNAASVYGALTILAGGGNAYLNLALIGNAGVNSLVPQVGSSVSNAGEESGFTAEVPIAGWSGSTAVQPGSRYLWAQRFAANATRVTTTPSKPGEYRCFTRAGGGTTYSDAAPTIPPSAADGILVKGGEAWGTSDPAGEPSRWQVFVGPGKIVQMMANSSAGRTGGIIVSPLDRSSNTWGVPWHYDSTTGIITFQKYISGSASSAQYCGIDPSGASSYNDAYVDFLVADDPVPVALAPAVHVEASSDAGQAVTANTTDLQYEDEVADTHGAWSGTAFSAPVAGTYVIVAIASTTGTGQGSLSIYKGGVVVVIGQQAGAAAGQRRTVTACMKLAAGDSVTIRSTVTETREATASLNRISITRIGDA